MSRITNGRYYPLTGCEVMVSARLRGDQHCVAQGVAAIGDPQGRSHIQLQVGRVLILLEDREAFESFAAAARTAIVMADRVFGPAVDEFDRAEERARAAFEKGRRPTP